MIFKNLIALLRGQKRIILYGDPEELQWVGDGGAIYPLHGMPGMIAADLQAVFDVPDKDIGKYLLVHRQGLPATPLLRGRGSGGEAAAAGGLGAQTLRHAVRAGADKPGPALL